MVLVALLVMGSAILLFSCKSKQNATDESLDAIKTEESENLSIVMSENGRKSYFFKTPLLEGYTLGRANYAIYYENRKLWEAKGDVVITKHDGTRLYTQQLFWNSLTKRIYSNVDTRLVTDTDEVIGEGFESDEEMNEPRFRRWKGKMQVDTEQLRSDAKGDKEGKTKENNKTDSGAKKAEPKSQPIQQPKSQPKPLPQTKQHSKQHPKLDGDMKKLDLQESQLQRSKIDGGREMVHTR